MRQRDQREQNTPLLLFLKRDGGSGEGGNFFSREKKFPLPPTAAADHSCGQSVVPSLNLEAPGILRSTMRGLPSLPKVSMG